jgi:ABC-type multidrug transport system ATPase subunit
VFGFLGPNGAGKTTIINMLTGLLKPDAGQVLIQGRPVQSGDPQVHRRVGGPSARTTSCCRRLPSVR